MDLGAIEICRALNLDRSESVKVLSKIYQRQRIPRWIKKLLRIYWLDRKFLDGSRSCREAIETKFRKLDGLRIR